MARNLTTAIVPAGHDLPDGRGITVLHTYANGDRLIEASAKQVAAIEPARVIPERARPQSESGGAGSDGPAGPEVIAVGEQAFATVELAGPPEGTVVERLEETGVELIAFEAPASYVVRGDRDALAAVADLALVRSVAVTTARDKPRVATPESGTRDVWIVLHEATAESTLGEVAAIAGLDLVAELEPPAGLYRRVAAVADGAAVEAALALPGVAAVEARVEIRLEDEVADLIVAGMMDSQRRPVGNYLRWLEDLGIDGFGVTIGINDNGVDEDHVAFSGRIVSHDGGNKQWHGTFVAGHAAGDDRGETDPSGFVYGVGTAPGADLISQSNTATPAESCRRTVTTAGAASGALGSVQNNSWGAGTAPGGMDYGSQEATYDGLVRDADGNGTPLTICFSAGNDGSNGLTRPKAAKNVLVTGNSESFRPEFGTDKPEAAPEADNPDEMYTGAHASSHGNCLDGRIRPHVCAPGEWTSAASFGMTPANVEYITDRMTWGGGTSGASPKTAGACALVIDWWADNVGDVAPSPAMLRAMIVNGATDTGAGGPVPNKHQGWGRVNLGAVFDDSVHKVYLDQSVVLTTIGDERRWNLQVSDPTKPVKVTLAWTDPPGTAGSGTATKPAIVNRLGLRLDVDGTTYHGNDYANGWSRSGSEPPDNGIDNLQNVALPGGTVNGSFTVTVRALQLAMNCLTNKPFDPRQDFALVIHNAHVDAGSSPVDMTILVDDAAAPDDGGGGNGGGGDGGDDSWSDDDGWDTGDDDGSNDGDDTWGDGTERPVLRRGDQGDDVRDLQQMLNDLGYDTNGIDGDFGSATQSAVRQFQADQGLGVDGVVGAATWDALEQVGSGGSSGGGSDPDPWSDPDPDPDPEPDPDPGVDPGSDPGSGIDVSDRPVLRRGDRGGDVRDLQQLLNDLGYDTNGIDGDFGGGTDTAVRQFQRDEGLDDDGVVGSATWERLGERAGGGGSSDGGWSDDGDWGDDPEATGRPERPRSEARRVPPVAGALATAMAVESGGVHTETALAPAVGGLRSRLVDLVASWSDPADDDGTVRSRSAVVVVGRGSRFSRTDVVNLRRLARLGTLYLVSDSRAVPGWLAQRLQVRRGVHYRLFTGPDGVDGAARAIVAEAHGRHTAVLAYRSMDGGAGSEVRLDLTELDRQAVVVVRGAQPTLGVTDPTGRTTRLTSRSRAVGLRLEHVDDDTMRLHLDGEQRDVAGSWVVSARRSDTSTVPLSFEATVAGTRPADMRIEARRTGATGPVAESGSARDQLVTVAATSGTLLQARVRAVSTAEANREQLDLRPARRRLGTISEATPTPERANEPPVTAPALSGLLPGSGQYGVTPVEVESRGVSAEGHRFQRAHHDEIVAVRSRSEHRRARGRRQEAMTLVRARVNEVQYDGAGLVTALLVRADDDQRVLLVEDDGLRALLTRAGLQRRTYLFGVIGDVVRSVVEPLGDAA